MSSQAPQLARADSPYFKSVYADQGELLRAIGALYEPGCFYDLDPTFGIGGMYRKTGIPFPRWAFDIAPRALGVEQADCRNLPLEDGVATSILFDPPFIHAPGEESIIGRQFGGLGSQVEIHEMYEAALCEFARVLRSGGRLVFKCQDVVESGRQVWTHCNVQSMALAHGFEAVDLFILTKAARVKGRTHHRQVHARKHHCYFWVFYKRGASKRRGSLVYVPTAVERLGEAARKGVVSMTGEYTVRALVTGEYTVGERRGRRMSHNEDCQCPICKTRREGKKGKSSVLVTRLDPEVRAWLLQQPGGTRAFIEGVVRERMRAERETPLTV